MTWIDKWSVRRRWISVYPALVSVSIERMSLQLRDVRRRSLHA